MDHLPVLRPAGPYHSLDRTLVTDSAGVPLAEVDMAPPLLVRRILEELRAAPTQEEPERMAALVQAGRLFATATLEGESPEDYCQKQSRATGLPVAVARRSLREMQEYLAALPRVTEAQRPAGARPPALIPSGGAAVWARRGKVLGVIAPSNHPMTHVSWLQALAFGYHVGVRPGRRDPFTPLRLARALLAAGLSPGHLAFVPGPHGSAGVLVEGADMAIAYGGDDMVEQYAGNPRVLVRGPGRSKLLLDGEATPERLGLLVSSIAGDGGVRCTNTSAVLAAGDHAGVARRLAERLAGMPVLDMLHPDAVLPVFPLAEAQAIRSWLDSRLEPGVDLCRPLCPEGPVADLGNGLAVLRPAVILCDTWEHPAFGLELPFPCVWVAPWTPAQGLKPLRDSLAVTLITGDRTLVCGALEEPSIRKLFWGLLPTWHSSPDLPHDGYLAQFLLEARGFAMEGDSHGPER